MRSIRDELLAAVLQTATDLNERLLALAERARRDPRLTQADVVWCRMALLAEVENERA